MIKLPAPFIDTRSLFKGVRVEEDKDKISINKTRSRRTSAS
jgi:hypothetical protein